MSRPVRAAPGSPCDAARARASLELDGMLDEVGSVWLRRHLATCPDCARVVAAMGSATRRLRAAPAEPCAVRYVRRPGSVGRGTQSWAGVAVALVALGIGTASVPGAADEPSGFERARVAAAAAAGPADRPKLPIGQRAALDDFVPGTAPLHA